MEDYFKKILQAQVYEVAKKTPLEKANNLSKALKNNIYLKREDLQEVFSFKIRGAFNKMRQLSQSQLANGVITSSAGNHAPASDGVEPHRNGAVGQQRRSVFGDHAVGVINTEGE